MSNTRTSTLVGIVAAALVVLACSTARAQAPANDLCTNALPITCGQSLAGTTIGATLEVPAPPTCITTYTAAGVWYTYTAASSGNVFAYTCDATGYDTKLHVYTGACGGPYTCITGNDDAACTFSGLRSRVNWAATAGTTYRILVSGFGAATGNFVLSLQCVPSPPPNDLCANAIDLSCGSNVFGATLGGTTETVTTCAGTSSNTSPTVWYRFTAPMSQNINISLCNPGTNFDTQMRVFTGTCAALPGSLVCVAGNDQGGGTCGNSSQVTFPAVGGTTYMIQVLGFSTGQGGFQLTLTCLPPPPPNDAICAATPISCGQSLSGTLLSATLSTPPGTGTCGLATAAVGDADVWYRFDGTGECVTATTCTTNPGRIRTELMVYQDSCLAPICVNGTFFDTPSASCPAVAGQGIGATVTFPTNLGQTYWLRVLNRTGQAPNGPFDISVTCAPRPVEDDICTALPVTLGVGVPFNTFCASAQLGEARPPAGGCDTQITWCDSVVTSSFWYSFVAPPGGCVSVRTNNTLDLQLAVWDPSNQVGCADFTNLTLLAANDDSGPGLSPFIDRLSCLTPGATYLVQLDGWNTTRGAGILTVEDCGNEPLSVDAGGCQSRLVNDLDDIDDINYLVATGSGGFPISDGIFPVGGLYLYTWVVVSGDADSILYTGLAGGAGAAVQPDVTTTYQVTIEDGRGCIATGTVTVEVVDVECESNKLDVCHVPDGNEANAHNICISVSGWLNGHFCRHGGDRLGPCDLACTATNQSFPEPPPCNPVSLTLTTDIFNGETSWTMFDDTTNLVLGSGAAGSQAASTTVTYQLGCIPEDHCIRFVINDSFGDGICCSFGLGDYTINLGNQSLDSPSGGAFGTQETVTLCPPAPPAPAPDLAKSLSPDDSGERGSVENAGVPQVSASLAGTIDGFGGTRDVVVISLLPRQDEANVRVLLVNALEPSNEVLLHDGPMTAFTRTDLRVDVGMLTESPWIARISSSSEALERTLFLSKADKADPATLVQVPYESVIDPATWEPATGPAVLTIPGTGLTPALTDINRRELGPRGQ